MAAGQVPVAVAYAVGRRPRGPRARRRRPLCNPDTAALLAGYVVMQLAYCVWLKHVLVVDLVVVTTGFLMRAMAGGLALGIALSRWFLITSGFGALFMVAAKRYSERSRWPGRRGRHPRAARRVHHRLPALRLAAGGRGRRPRLLPVGHGERRRRTARRAAVATAVVVPFILSVLRYAVFADGGSAGEPEDVVLRDRALAVIALAWVALYVLAVADW